MLIRTCRNRTTAGNNTCIQPIRLASYPEARHLSDRGKTTKCLLLISSTGLSNLFMNPISYPIRILLAPSPDYRWGEHLCLLAPLGAIMAFVILCLGWWGEPVRQFFSPLATADIHITRFMSVVTHIGNPLIYVFYLVLLLVALTKRDWRETMFVLRCVLFSVFFLCFVMQIMKYGLGMPRPGFPWPPYPLGFINQYASFPSGHTATIITAALPLALWFRNRPFSLFLSAVIALMGFSRVWLGQHHPIDIVGGMLLGSIAARCIACERLPMGKEEQQALGEQKIREETGK